MTLSKFLNLSESPLPGEVEAIALSSHSWVGGEMSPSLYLEVFHITHQVQCGRYQSLWAVLYHLSVFVIPGLLVFLLQLDFEKRALVTGTLEHDSPSEQSRGANAYSITMKPPL